MGYGKRVIVKSKVLAGQKNGDLDLGILVTLTPLPEVGGADVRLIAPAARGYAALRAAALAAGHKLKPTSASDSYRTYAIQKSTFQDRYVPKNLPGRPSKTWDGTRWYQKPGTAMAAVPGTSNHGWAAAVDVGEENDGDAGTEPIDNATLTWLLANEERFGFFHGVSSEPWHIEWFPGDAIPAAVIEWEETGGDEMDQATLNTLKADTFRLLALLGNQPFAEYHLVGEPKPRKEENVVHRELADIKAALENLAAPPEITDEQLERVLRRVLGMSPSPTV